MSHFFTPLSLNHKDRFTKNRQKHSTDYLNLNAHNRLSFRLIPQSAIIETKTSHLRINYTIKKYKQHTHETTVGHHNFHY